MIKIELTNPDTIKEMHLSHFELTLTNQLSQTIKEAQNSQATEEEKNEGSKDKKGLIELIKYLKDNVEKILTGKREELEKIITEVEEKYYIDPDKLINIKNKRKKIINGNQASEIVRVELDKYILLNNLLKHFDDLDEYYEPEESGLINVFNEKIDVLVMKWRPYQDVLKAIFDYQAFSDAEVNEGEEGWSAYELVERLNVGVCPYCNRAFTTTLKKGAGIEKKTRPELDHYYPKSRYRYLALSLYNLIPSCGVCNRSMKGVVDFYKNEAIHPYDEEFLGVASFSTDFDYTKDDSYKFLLGDSNDFKITFKIDTTDNELRKRIERSIKVFGLEELYNTHRDIVVDIIMVSRMYTEERIKELRENFDFIFSSDEEILQSLYLNYMTPENLGKRPLAKLTQDISNELGLSITDRQKKMI